MRNIARCYSLSYHSAKDDPMILEQDFKIEVGNRRRSYINKALHEFARQYPNHVTPATRMQGTEGYNNRVELEVGRFLITHHHQTNSDAMPVDFINLRSEYNYSNALLNDPLQLDLIPPSQVVNSDYFKPFLNMLILHEKSRESLQEMGNIEFVFPQKGKKIVILRPEELIRRQNVLRDMSESDLCDFKLSTDEQLKRLVE